mgnify:CR=1 FL=1
MRIKSTAREITGLDKFLKKHYDLIHVKSFKLETFLHGELLFNYFPLIKFKLIH